MTTFTTTTSSRAGMKLTGKSNEVKLTRRELFRLNHRQGDLLLKALSGILWVTLPNDPNDYFLRAGDYLPVTQRGTVLVEAMADACFQIR